MRTDRPVLGRRVHVGAVEVGHLVVVDVGIACGCGQADGPTGHWQRHGKVRAGHMDTSNWEKKETTQHKHTPVSFIRYFKNKYVTLWVSNNGSKDSTWGLLVTDF